MSANVRHSSESAEHFTPEPIVAAARTALGGEIDLDPATTAGANAFIGARTIYTAETNGFDKSWGYSHQSAVLKRTVFLNPPGGRCDAQGRRVIGMTKAREDCEVTGDCGLPPAHEHEGVRSSQKAWWEKLAREYRENRVSAFVFVSFSIELLQTSQVNAAGLTPHDCVIFFPSRRIAYLRADRTPGTSPPHSSMLIYGGPEPDAFVAAFAPLRGRFMSTYWGPRPTA